MSCQEDLHCTLLPLIFYGPVSFSGRTIVSSFGNVFPEKIEAHRFYMLTRKLLKDLLQSSLNKSMNEIGDFTFLFPVTFLRLINWFIHFYFSSRAQRKLKALGLNGHLLPTTGEQRQGKTPWPSGGRPHKYWKLSWRHLRAHLHSICIQAQLSPRPTDSFPTVTAHEDDIPAPGCCRHCPHVPLAECCAALPFHNCIPSFFF